MRKNTWAYENYTEIRCQENKGREQGVVFEIQFCCLSIVVIDEFAEWS